MLLTTIALAGLALPPATPAPTAVDHGKLAWFDGTWDELLAEAERSNKIIFLDFWADW